MMFCFLIGASNFSLAQTTVEHEASLKETDQVQIWVSKGLTAHRKDDLMDAITWLSKAAKEGHAHAKAMLGYIYIRSGENELALPLLTAAADLNEGLAQYELATIYGQGTLVEKNDGKAVELLEKSIAQDYFPAFVTLAKAHEEGSLGLKKNNAKALEYYQQASDKGYSTATYRLISAYKNGELGLAINQQKVKDLKAMLDKASKQRKEDSVAKMNVDQY